VDWMHPCLSILLDDSNISDAIISCSSISQ